jgi:hypothetical protein
MPLHVVRMILDRFLSNAAVLAAWACAAPPRGSIRPSLLIIFVQRGVECRAVDWRYTAWRDGDGDVAAGCASAFKRIFVGANAKARV